MSESNGGAEKNGADEGVQEADIMPADEQSPLEQMMAERDNEGPASSDCRGLRQLFRKRTRKDIEESMRRGREDAVREILPVADNLERALAAAPMTAAPDALLDGVKMVLKLLQDSLERLGVTRIVTVGERFDPALHEAIQQVETTEHPMGTIVAELVPGYKNGERLVVPRWLPSRVLPQSRSELSSHGESHWYRFGHDQLRCVAVMKAASRWSSQTPREVAQRPQSLASHRRASNSSAKWPSAKL